MCYFSNRPAGCYAISYAMLCYQLCPLSFFSPMYEQVVELVCSTSLHLSAEAPPSFFPLDSLVLLFLRPSPSLPFTRAPFVTALLPAGSASVVCMGCALGVAAEASRRWLVGVWQLRVGGGRLWFGDGPCVTLSATAVCRCSWPMVSSRRRVCCVVTWRPVK